MVFGYLILFDIDVVILSRLFLLSSRFNWEDRCTCVYSVSNHNLLNIWNKFQLINNSCFYFKPCAFLIIHSSTLDDLTWESWKPPNQSELKHLDTCLLNLATVFCSHMRQTTVRHFEVKDLKRQLRLLTTHLCWYLIVNITLFI